MPELFLVASLIGAAFTLNAFRPRSWEWAGLPSFFAGWLTSELPLHHLAWQAVATFFFVAAGALEEWPGWVALGVTVVSWVGLVVLAREASRAATVIESAMREQLGDDYRERIDPELAAADDPGTPWRRLVLPFGGTDPAVEKVKDITFAQEGELALKLDVYRPRSGATGCPVLVYIHGGGWVMGDKKEQGRPMMSHLAARGWVCVTANYRLSPKATFPDHLVDVKRALAWTRRHVAEYGGDPRSIVIAGGSAGGHLAALAALTPNDPEYQPGFEDVDTSVLACIPFYGVYDFTNRAGFRRRGMEWFLARAVMKKTFDDDPEAYEKASPMSLVAEDAPPFFIVHGANDSLVPVREARHFAELLRGVAAEPVVYVELPHAQHAFEIFRSLRTAHIVTAVERYLAWVLSAVEVAADEENDGQAAMGRSAPVQEGLPSR